MKKWERNAVPGALCLLCFKMFFTWSFLRCISPFWKKKVCYPVQDPKYFLVHTADFPVGLAFSLISMHHSWKNKQHSPTGKRETLKHGRVSFCSFTLFFPTIHNPILSKSNIQRVTWDKKAGAMWNFPRKRKVLRLWPITNYFPETLENGFLVYVL